MLTWVLAGWKMRLCLAIWLGWIAGACAWRFFAARKFTFRLGNRWTAIAIVAFGMYSLALGYKLVYRYLVYDREILHPEIECTLLADTPQQIRQSAAVNPGPHDWPWWRGPSFDNHSDSSSAPIQWDAQENVLWKSPVPGRGHSSPILCGQHLFLTTADEKAQSQSLLAYDRDQGNLIWTKLVHQGRFAHQHAKNSYASATPACDGRHVYTTFAIDGSVYVTAVDLSSQIVWQQCVSEYTSTHGYCASPVLYNSVVIVMVYGDVRRRIAAFDRSTGERRWQSQFRISGANYGTPAIGHFNGSEYLVIPGPYAIQGFDPATGNMQWSIGWNVAGGSNTVAFAGQKVFASGTDPQNNVICIEIGATGVHELWRVTTGATKVPSPLVVKDQLFLVTDNGIADCLEAATGKRIGRCRLGGNFSSSPVLAAGRIYVASEDGRTFVLSADQKLEILATNDIGEPVFATPVISNQRLFLRSAENLYCIASEELSEAP